MFLLLREDLNPPTADRNPFLIHWQWYKCNEPHERMQSNARQTRRTFLLRLVYYYHWRFWNRGNPIYLNQARYLPLFHFRLRALPLVWREEYPDWLKYCMWSLLSQFLFLSVSCGRLRLLMFYFNNRATAYRKKRKKKGLKSEETESVIAFIFTSIGCLIFMAITVIV